MIQTYARLHDCQGEFPVPHVGVNTVKILRERYKKYQLPNTLSPSHN